MTRATAAALTTLLILGTAACGAATPPPPSAGSAGAAEQLFERRAAQVVSAWTEGGLLERWAGSFVPAEPLTRLPGWTRGSLKAAFYGGWVRTAVPLPDAAGKGSVSYADGTRVSVGTLGAQTAYEGMVNPRSGECPPADNGASGCDWVTVTGAKATTISLQTGRGVATVPAWAFTVQGLTEPIVRVSVENAAESSDFEPRIGPPPTDGRRVLLNGQDVASQHGSKVTVALGSGDCDTEVAPRVLETDQVVVVGGTALGPAPDRLCNALLRIHEVVLELDRPAGTRPVLDAASGRPLLPRVEPRS